MQKTKALSWLFPENIRRVEKQADSYFWGVDAQEIPGGKPEVWLALSSELCHMTLSRVEFLTLAAGSHVWMWELNCEESWALKNWCFWTVVLEKTLESPLDCKEIQPTHPKGNQSWIFIGRTGAEAETPILWPPDARTDSLEKTLMLGKIEGRRRSGRQRMR